jgi:hypothetical protein
MYDGMRTTKPLAAVYFLFVFVMGNYVMLNLFLAILLDQFAGGDNGISESRARDASDDLALPAVMIMPATSARHGDPDVEHSRQLAVAQEHASILLAFHVRTAKSVLMVVCRPCCPSEQSIHKLGCCCRQRSNKCSAMFCCVNNEPLAVYMMKAHAKNVLKSVRRHSEKAMLSTPNIVMHLVTLLHWKGDRWGCLDLKTSSEECWRESSGTHALSKWSLCLLLRPVSLWLWTRLRWIQKAVSRKFW